MKYFYVLLRTIGTTNKMISLSNNTDTRNFDFNGYNISTF